MNYFYMKNIKILKMTIEQTINSVYVFFAQVGNKYVVIHGNEVYYTNERPMTDQDVRRLERELQSVRNEINYLRYGY